MKKEEKEKRPNLPIGTIKVRTFMLKPMCPWCQEKGVHRWLVEVEQNILTNAGPPMASWVCDHCEFSVSLPPGAFPSYKHQEVHLEATLGPKRMGQN